MPSRQLPNSSDLAQGDERSIGRALTAITRGQVGFDQWPELEEKLKSARRPVLYTGAPGAGKSTLLREIVPEIRSRGETVAILAHDPASPFTGGAFLGDRLRWDRLAEDQGVFARSIAQRGHEDAARGIDAVRLLQAVGYDHVFVETVGVGQIVSRPEPESWLRIVVMPAGQGDEAQMLKAGLLETGNLYVVTKGDLPGARAWTERLRDMLSLGQEEMADVIGVSSTERTGIDVLVDRLREMSATTAD